MKVCYSDETKREKERQRNKDTLTVRGDKRNIHVFAEKHGH